MMLTAHDRAGMAYDSQMKAKKKAKKKAARNERPAKRQSVPPPTQEPPHRSSALDFPVVGIGASAGGLDALEKFLGCMPRESGIALVLIPHLDPTHESLMVELLARATSIPACEAQQDMPIEANHVYVIPPNRYPSIGDGALRLSDPKEQRGLRTAIDTFFRSLAAAMHERAIGVILSGTSSHGTLGIKEIKLAGGMVMVQEPESAQYDQMPKNAIATGLVDYVLPPEKMPDALVSYVRHAYRNGALETWANAGESVRTTQRWRSTRELERRAQGLQRKKSCR